MSLVVPCSDVLSRLAQVETCLIVLRVIMVCLTNKQMPRRLHYSKGILIYTGVTDVLVVLSLVDFTVLEGVWPHQRVVVLFLF
jgi:hypothetical protein